MNTAIENKIISFVRDVVLSDNIEKDLRKQALDLLLEYERKTSFVEIKDCQPAEQTFCLRKTDYDKIQDYILESRKLEAIKELRAITGWGLKQSKEAIESPQNFKQPAPQKW